jgi:hypothetical protein
MRHITIIIQEKTVLENDVLMYDKEIIKIAQIYTYCLFRGIDNLCKPRCLYNMVAGMQK